MINLIYWLATLIESLKFWRIKSIFHQQHCEKKIVSWNLRCSVCSFWVMEHEKRYLMKIIKTVNNTFHDPASFSFSRLQNCPNSEKCVNRKSTFVEIYVSRKEQKLSRQFVDTRKAAGNFFPLKIWHLFKENSQGEKTHLTFWSFFVVQHKFLPSI